MREINLAKKNQGDKQLFKQIIHKQMNNRKLNYLFQQRRSTSTK